MHGPRCFLQELPGHVHFCMGAYGEYSSRLRNFGGFKLVTNLKGTKEAKCNYGFPFLFIEYSHIHSEKHYVMNKGEFCLFATSA